MAMVERVYPNLFMVGEKEVDVWDGGKGVDYVGTSQPSEQPSTRCCWWS